MFQSKTWSAWSQKLKNMLGSTNEKAFSKEELEKLLFESDLPASMIEILVKKTNLMRELGKEEVLTKLVSETTSILEKISYPPLNLPKPASILLVGINGSGKTTTAARLAQYYRKQGRDVILGAADTFRAGAVEQLKTWGERLDIEVVSQAPKADPASVVFETWKIAKEKNALMIADTAGRIHTQTPLMDQLQKIFRVLSKGNDGAPHEVWLVLDGTSGQNAAIQSREFGKAVPLTGLVITKLDGTSKGGGALFSSVEMNLPIRFVGIGEKPDDLIEFKIQSFVQSFYGI